MNLWQAILIQTITTELFPSTEQESPQHTHTHTKKNSNSICLKPFDVAQAMDVCHAGSLNLNRLHPKRNGNRVLEGEPSISDALFLQGAEATSTG